MSGTDESGALHEHFPGELKDADETDIDWDALCSEIGEVRGFYELPTTPEGAPGPWLDKLEVCQAVSRHVRDGGTVDINEVLH